MSLPIINYKYNNLDEAKSLSDILEQKLTSLEKFFPPEGSQIICEVEFEKVAEQNHGRIYRIEVNLTLDGTLYRADAVEESFEKAIDEVRDELDKELRRAKEKHSDLDIQAARALKEKLLSDS